MLGSATRRVLLLFMVLCIGFIMVVGCDQLSEKVLEYEYTIDSAIVYIEDAGFEVKNRTENWFWLIGAVDGVNIDVGQDGISVELYIDGGEIQKSMFEKPREGAQAFSVSNLYVYIHTDDIDFYEKMKAVFEEK